LTLHPNTAAPLGPSADADALLTALNARPDLADLLALWQARRPDVWGQSIELYRRLGRLLMELGEPLLAYDVLAEGLQIAPEDVVLRQRKALALARCGVSDKANAILTQLVREGNRDCETLGLLARTFKDLGEQTPDPTERRRYWEQTFGCYSQAYQAHEGNRTAAVWTGTNAATLALLLGQTEKAHSLAREIQALALEELRLHEAASGDLYWPLASLGEIALLLGDCPQAEHWYLRAVAEARGRFGHLKTTRRNARLIVRHLGAEAGRIEQHLRIPCLIVFAGHRLDLPGRPSPRFPLALEPAVRRAIRERLETLGAGFGYAFAFGGADLLFLEEMLNLQGDVRVLLPYDADQFYRDKVDTMPGPDGRGRFERALKGAREVIVASRHPMEGKAAREYVNLLLLGLASIRAQKLGADLVALACWDGRRGEAASRTAEVVQLWERFGHSVETIDLNEILRTHELQAGGGPEPSPESEWPPEPPGFETHRMAILFADAVRFGELTEQQVPRFVRDFLGMIGDLLKATPHPPLIKNTWGDGLYFVFAGVREAGCFALELSERVLNTSWVEKGLPESLGLRIALHAGPVYACTDPVTGQRNYVGTQVSRAARIEPVTPPGYVYASQEFAAMASAERVREFTCEYVGLTPLPKNAGTMATYHVRGAKI
jgi:class 3 adenylate cyclase/tetratricopeptide (TPR) repeat protein